MATRRLGLEIHNEYLSAVLLEQRGSSRVVTACSTVALEEGEDLAAALSSLLARHNFKGSSCVIGLPLAWLSMRNIFLPFSEQKKISQILPLELEEQLLLPVSAQVTDFVVTSRREEGSFLLVGALEKKIVATVCSVLQDNGLRPRALLPTVSVLAEHHCADRRQESGIFLAVDRHGVDLVFRSGGRVLFMRRIPWPGDVLEQASAADEDAYRAIKQLAAAIRFSLYHVYHDFAGQPVPGQVFVSGWPEEAGWPEALAGALELETVPCPALSGLVGIAAVDNLSEDRDPGALDGALALALHGFAKRRDDGLDFLQGEFAAASWQLFSRRTLLAAALSCSLLGALVIGALWLDSHRLENRALLLHRKMTAIFKQTFPEVSRIVDPYVQMQSKLREARGSKVSLPLFSGDKRVLAILADISARVPKTISLHVFRLVIDQESVQIKGLTDAYNNVNVIKNKLVESTRYQEVKIISATADKDKGSIRFEIRLQLAEAS